MAGEVKTFDEAMAESWRIRVKAELDSVDATLQMVANECQESPYEDDVVFRGIMQTGRGFGEAWSELDKQFDATVEGMFSVIKTIHETVGNIIDDMQSFITGKEY